MFDRLSKKYNVIDLKDLNLNLTINDIDYILDNYEFESLKNKYIHHNIHSNSKYGDLDNLDHSIKYNLCCLNSEIIILIDKDNDVIIREFMYSPLIVINTRNFSIKELIKICKLQIFK